MTATRKPRSKQRKTLLRQFLDELEKHEEREFRRDEEREHRERQRHDELIKEVRDFRALALGVIGQRTNIEKSLDRLEERVTVLELERKTKEQ